MSLNVATMLRESANAQPEKPYCLVNDLSFTYAQVEEISGRVASGLLATGLQRGDMFAFHLRYLALFLFSYFGLL